MLIDRLSYIDKIQATVGKARLFGDLAFRARQYSSKAGNFQNYRSRSEKSSQNRQSTIVQV